MSSLIEQAAERLEQLRQAGVVVPAPAPSAARTSAIPFAEPLSAAAAVPLATPVDGSAAALPQRIDNPVANRAANEAFVPPSVPGDPKDLEAAPAGSDGAVSNPAPKSQSPRIEFDFDALAAVNLITPRAPRSQIADQYRVIKRPLINNAVGRGAATPTHANLIMVTSAIANEGKSFSSINLAMSIAAELDNTVMLVDADLARPSLPRMLGIEDGPGLLDVLDGSAEMSSVLLRTNVDKLTLLRGGTPHSRATEMLASEAMRQLLDDMARRYPDRIIIFDSPPLLLTTESRVLATNMGQIVVVVRAGFTLQSDVQAALATIEACPLKMMLLNQNRASAAGSYGLGYGYGYGYGYGSKSSEA